MFKFSFPGHEVQSPGGLKTPKSTPWLTQNVRTVLIPNGERVSKSSFAIWQKENTAKAFDKTRKFGLQWIFLLKKSIYYEKYTNPPVTAS